MKEEVVFSLFLFAAICFYIAAIINLFGYGSRWFMEIIIGTVFLIAAFYWFKKYKTHWHDKD